MDRKRGKAGGGRKGRKQAAGPGGQRKRRRPERKKGFTAFHGWANLGRSRGKTVVTILSLSLAVVLFTVTVILVNSFDMDKYIAKFTASDFILADAGKLQATGEIFNEDMALPETAVDAVPGLRAGSRTGAGSMEEPPPFRSLSAKRTFAPQTAGGVRRRIWIIWCASRRKHRTEGSRTTPSSTVWSPLPWII